METLPSFKKVMAMGKNSVITIRMELKSDKQVKTFWAVKMWSVKTYVKKVTKVISTVELKKNDKNAPRTKASFRNQESSDLKTNKQTIHGKSKANSRDKNIASLSIVVKKKRNRSCLVGQKKFSPSPTSPPPRDPVALFCCHWVRKRHMYMLWM